MSNEIKGEGKETKDKTNIISKEGNDKQSETKEGLKEKEIPQVILSDKPFPYNVRRWLPEIELDKIIPSLKHPHYHTRIIQYNVLCDSLLPISTKIVEDDIPKLPYLLWENRSKKILSELKTLNGDLISLIEIEKDENFIKELNSYGYELAFKTRTGKHSEGCAIAWKIEKYELIDLLSICFNMNKNEKNMSEIFNRDNIALIGIFKLIEIPNTIFLFATTHLVFNIKRGDIKLGQIYQLMKSLEELRKKYEDELKNKVYIFLGSDLNCTPKSGIYKLLTTGKLNCNLLNRIYLSGQDTENLQYVNPPIKIRSYLFNKITSLFKEETKYKNNYNDYNYNNNYNINNGPSQENVKWFNEICRIQPVIKDHKINLEYRENYKYEEYNLMMKIPFIFKSAYSTMTKNCLEFFNNNYNEIPFNLIKDINEIEINGLKIGKKEIEKTNSFVKGLTLDNPFSYYSNDTVLSLDYIFYYSKNDDIKVIRTLNCPDMFKLFFDIGYMPNEIYPSDHFSIAADLIIGEEK